MIAVVSASFKLKLLIGIIIISSASFLTSTYTYHTYKIYELEPYPLAPSDIEIPVLENESNQQDGLTENSSEINVSTADTEHEDPPPGNSYFRQPGDTNDLAHIDERYYTGIALSTASRQASLRQLARSYLTITRSLKLETWIAHGTLLGWWWNGQIFPWDRDLDVQVSDETLFDMARRFNMSEFVWEWEDDGSLEYRTYMLDVNAQVWQRAKGLGDNIIDARWIDTSNGLFIDITGISQLHKDEGDLEWTCKNDHSYETSDIWPLEEVEFEGVKAFVPALQEAVLRAEYGNESMTMTEYEEHTWQPESRLWLPNPTNPNTPIVEERTGPAHPIIPNEPAHRGWLMRMFGYY